MDSLMALGTSYDQLLHLQRPVFRSRPIRGHYCEVISAVSTNQRPLSRPTFYMSHYGYAVYKTKCNKCYLYFFKGVPLGLVLLLKTTTGSGVEALTWGGGCCVITCPVPCLTFDYWASLELTVTGGDRTIQSGQDWRQSHVCGLTD